MYTQIRDYAKSRGVSYETVRRQVTQYEQELRGHIKKDGKTRLLDDKACDILDKHRQQKTVIVQPTDSMVLNEVDRLKQIIDQQKDQIIALQNEKIKYIEEKAKSETLLAIADKEHDELNNLRQENALHLDSLKKATEELNEKTAELNRYTKTIFGLYRKS